MEKIYETIERSHKDFICKQNMFFVETAPNAYLILLFLFCGIHPGGLYAQNQNGASSPCSFYVKASAGYGMGINGAYLVNNLNESITTTTSKLGNGWYGNVSGGYQYNDNLGAELGLGYEYGLKNNTFPPFNGNSSQENGNMWQLTPSVVFSSKTGRLVPYIKTGLIVALPEILEDELVNLTLNPSSPDREEIKYRINGGLSTGVQTAIGCSMPLRNSRWVVFAEASFSDIGFLPEKALVYSATANGIEQVSTLPENQKEIVFKRSSTFNPLGNNNPSQPTSYPETKYAFGSLTFNLGAKLNLGNITPASAQVDILQHYLIRASIGYGFAANGNIDYEATNTHYKAVNISYGNGINADLGVAYMINESLGFDLGFNEVSSPVFKPGSGTHWSHNFYGYDNQISESGNMFQVNPSLVIGTHIHKLEPYARLGILIGSGNVYYNYEDNHAFLNGNYYDRLYTMKFYGGTSVGYNAVLGTGFWLSYKYDLIAEACFNSIYEIPEKGVLVKDNYDGISNLSNESTSEKETMFKSSYDPNSPPDSDSPSVSSPVKFSFNAVVFRMGIRMWFGRKPD